MTDFAPGDVVTGVVTALDLFTGVMAEQVVFDADQVVAVPAGVSPEQAVAVGLVGVTARDIGDALSLTGDDVVLVAGATGGVGVLAVQLAAATGATVIGTAGHGDEEFVRGLGAAHVVDHTGDLAKAVRDVTVIPVAAAGSPEKVAALLGAVATGDLRVHVATTFPMAEATAAVAAFGTHQLGKLVVTVG